MAKKSEAVGDLMSQLANMNVLTKKETLIKTGILPLDMYVAGKNEVSEDIGFVKGKLVSITGEPGIGKSSLCMEMSKRWCKQGFRVVYCDYEGGLNEKSIEDFGLTKYAAYDRENPKKAIQSFIDGDKPFLVLNPVTFSQTGLIWYKLLEELKVKIDVGIFDSLKAMQTIYLTENIESLEQLPMGINARAQEGFLPLMKTLFAKHDILGVFINQFRMQNKGQVFFDGEPSNKAFLHNMDERMIMKKKKEGEITLKVENDEKEIVEKKMGNWVNLTLTKSRMGNSFSVLSLPIIFGKGVSVIYKYTAVLIANNVFTPGAYSNSKTDLTPLKEVLTCVGDVSNIPDSSSRGMDGVYEVIRENFELIEKYIVENNLLFVERIV